MKDTSPCLVISRTRDLGFAETHSAPARSLFEELFASHILLGEDWQKLPNETRQNILECPDREDILAQLVRHNLLTDYQARRLSAGTVFGLVLGNYRVLDRLGAGGMGIVFKAEHIYLRRQVAIKVLPMSRQQSFLLQQRFAAEMRAIAQLKHPNVVHALDAGVIGPSNDGTTLHYFVMEHIPGQDLEQYVDDRGPLPVATACEMLCQVADAMQEAHEHKLVHRDIKPSNIMVTPEGQTRLLDFGLARHVRSRMTEPGVVLGTLDYMSPEQARDASSVDIRADIYSLGGTLYWALTGRPPFDVKDNLLDEVIARATQRPPTLRTIRPDAPAALEGVLACLMAIKPDDRYSTPAEARRALLPFVQQSVRNQMVLSSTINGTFATPNGNNGHHRPTGERVFDVLLVDDEESIRRLCRHALDGLNCRFEEAANGTAALAALTSQSHDLVLLDYQMPDMTGLEVCQRIRSRYPESRLKILLFSGQSSPDDMATMLSTGTDDYLPKPLSIIQLRARVRALLRLKETQDHADLLNHQLLAVNHDLERDYTASSTELSHARHALVHVLAKVAEQRAGETNAHLLRLQRYCRCLAEEASQSPLLSDEVSDDFIEMLECCVPLHDIGKIALPDHILLKPSKLDMEERLHMETHTIIGADILRTVMEQHRFAPAFLHMAVDVTRSHHERYDGMGYPDKLAGSKIPLAARMTALADVYDALRSRRPYKPAMTHKMATKLMNETSTGQFDPTLLQMFQRCAQQFESIYNELAD